MSLSPPSSKLTSPLLSNSQQNVSLLPFSSHAHHFWNSPFSRWEGHYSYFSFFIQFHCLSVDSFQTACSTWKQSRWKRDREMIKKGKENRSSKKWTDTWRIKSKFMGGGKMQKKKKKKNGTKKKEKSTKMLYKRKKHCTRASKVIQPKKIWGGKERKSNIISPTPPPLDTKSRLTVSCS